MVNILELKGRVPSKKNSKKIFVVNGRIVIAPSTEYAKWERQARKQLASQAQPGTKLFSGQIILKVFAPDKRKSDLTNKAESVMDLLVSCGYLEDDNWFIVSDLRLMFGGVDKENPRIEIFSEK